MTFQELLTKTRGTDWTPPASLLALDPGETTGVAFFTDGEPAWVEQIDTKGMGIVEIDYKIKKVFPDLVVCEDYRIRANTANIHIQSEILTVRYIGAIEYICEREHIKLIKIMPSVSKGFFTNDRLKDFGFYRKGKRHGMDAMRLGCHLLLFNKEV
jgi:hypothetical protein